MTRQPSRAVLRRPSHLLLAAAVAASLLTVSACSGSSDEGGSTADGSSDAYGFDAVEQDPSAPITVWVDASREPAVDAFEEAYPDVELNVETYDGGADGSGSFQTKIEAFNQAGSGWPDVVFSTQNNDAAWASQGTEPFAAPVDKGLFDSSFLDGFTEGALAPLTVDGTVYGLRNDLAPTVTWYDKSLMDQFGYTPPTTWEEYEALGKQVATEHPGYIVGAIGDSWTPEVYFWGGQAPMNTVTGVDEFSADASDPKTVAMAEVLDGLNDAGVLAQESVFSPEFLQKHAGKVLMLPGPVWYSGALFQNPDSLNAAPGTMTAGVPLSWDGEDPCRRQRRRWDVVRLPALGQPRGGQGVPDVRDERRPLPGRPRARPARLLGRSRQVAGQAGGGELLHRRTSSTTWARPPRWSGTAGATRSSARSRSGPRRSRPSSPAARAWSTCFPRGRRR